ncbi:MAG: hypothetical protein CVU03_06320 [Bacteroidetes bacterium HGW-Bacteroidetes-2]|jgi:hypothetical protein|nr:MAG: hypothetical protein CVU03_06320 [Bacteroidetes bacterium HGW-Bacteroidetes-2]
MAIETSSLSNFELIIKLIEAIIWPVTLFLILFLFRKNFVGAFQRLGSLKVDSSGIAFSFEKELEKAKTTFEMLKPEKMRKEKSSIEIGNNTPNDPPYQELLTIKESLEKAVLDLAIEEGISVSHKSTPLLCDALEAKGALTKQKSELTKTLLRVVNMAGMHINPSQILEIKKMYNAL